MGRSKQKEFWLELSPSASDEQVQELADLARPDVVLVQKPTRTVGTKIASRLPGGDIQVIDRSEEVKPCRDAGVPTALEMVIRDQTDHRKVLEGIKVRPDYLIIECPHWKIIPLENLVAENIDQGTGKTRLLARTRTYEESRTALGALELGVDGVALQSNNPEEARKTRALVSENEEAEVSLSTAKVESVKPIQMGSRVCVDTTEIIRPEEGLLVGCSSQALFLVEAEVHANPHVSARPFRVNAGPVSLYVLTPETKTRYLSDLQAGESVLVVGKNGRSRNVDVARVKVERRPLVLVEARSGDKTVKTILQNAETVRLLGPDGSIPVHTLKPGDEVYVRLENGGRHFGNLVEDEMIIEK